MPKQPPKNDPRYKRNPLPPKMAKEKARIESIPAPPMMIQDMQAEAERHGGFRTFVEFSKPQQAATALWMRAQGCTYKKIIEATGLHLDTCRGLMWRQEDTLEAKKKEFSRRYAQIADMYGDLLTEKAEQLMNDPEALAKISPDRLALTLGIMTDQSAKLSGMAGVIVEHRKGASIDDAAKMIAEAKARIADKIKNQAIEAEIIEPLEDDEQ